MIRNIAAAAALHSLFFFGIPVVVYERLQDRQIVSIGIGPAIHNTAYRLPAGTMGIPDKGHRSILHGRSRVGILMAHDINAVYIWHIVQVLQIEADSGWNRRGFKTTLSNRLAVVGKKYDGKPCGVDIALL